MPSRTNNGATRSLTPRRVSATSSRSAPEERSRRGRPIGKGATTLRILRARPCGSPLATELAQAETGERLDDEVGGGEVVRAGETVRAGDGEEARRRRRGDAGGRVLEGDAGVGVGADGGARLQVRRRRRFRRTGRVDGGDRLARPSAARAAPTAPRPRPRVSWRRRRPGSPPRPPARRGRRCRPAAPGASSDAATAQAVQRCGRRRGRSRARPPRPARRTSRAPRTRR